MDIKFPSSGSVSLSDATGVLPVANGGTGVTVSTGTGATVLSTSPTLVTPNIGVATGTSLTVNDNTTLGSSNADTVNFNARVSSEFTPATDNTYDLGRTGHEWRDLYIDGTANIDSLVADTADVNGGTIDGATIGGATPAAGTFTDLSDSGGNVRLIPQNSQSAAYTLVASDSGKHILHPSADTTARTFTIPANASVPYTIGTAVTFVNQNSAGVVTIAITSDTMRLAGAGTTGSRTLAANGVATAMKITSTEWIISGNGLT